MERVNICGYTTIQRGSVDPMLVMNNAQFHWKDAKKCSICGLSFNLCAGHAFQYPIATTLIYPDCLKYVTSVFTEHSKRCLVKRAHDHVKVLNNYLISTKGLEFVRTGISAKEAEAELAKLPSNELAPYLASHKTFVQGCLANDCSCSRLALELKELEGLHYFYTTETSEYVRTEVVCESLAIILQTNPMRYSTNAPNSAAKKLAKKSSLVITPELIRNSWFSAIYIVPPNLHGLDGLNGGMNCDKINVFYDSVTKTFPVGSERFPECESKLTQKERANKLLMYRKILYFTTGSLASKTQTEQLQKVPVPLKTVATKEGILRYYGANKICGESARTVIEPQSTQDARFGQVGIPDEFSSVLLVNELVHTHNLEAIRKASLLRNFSSLVPKVTLARTGTTVKLNSYELAGIYIPALGDILHRKMFNGDPVMLVRYPVLQGHSVMGAHAELNSYTASNRESESRKGCADGHKTIRLNPASTASYGADYDGDEMNITSAGKSASATLELLTVLHSTSNMTSGKGIEIAPLFHELLNLYTASYYSNVELSAQQANLVRNRLISAFGEEQFDAKCKAAVKAQAIVPRQVTVRLLLSFCFPSDFSYETRAKSDNKFDLDGGHFVPNKRGKYTDKDLVIIRGVYVTGVLNDAAIGRKFGSITHQIAINYGEKKTAKFVDDCYKVSSIISEVFIQTFSMKMFGTPLYLRSDLARIREQNASISSVIYENSELAVKLTSQPIMQCKSLVERELLNSENRLNPTSQIPAVLNSLSMLISSGARGKTQSITHPAMLLGQQFNASGMAGMQAKSKYISADSSIATGYIKRSLIEGLGVEDIISYANASRPDLVVQRTEIENSGTLARRLQHALQIYSVSDTLAITAGNLVVSRNAFGYLDTHRTLKTKVFGLEKRTVFNESVLAGNIQAKFGWV